MSDLFVDITFNKKKGTVTSISNMNQDSMIDIMEKYLELQIGKGEDNREPEKQKKYRVILEVDLSDDTIECSSNTGNDGLTAGIVMKCLQQESLVAT